MKKYYEILGLKEGATKQDIKKAFNKLSKELDPKKNDNQDFFIEETKMLKEAYEKLMNSSILSTQKALDKSNKMDNRPSNKTNNVKPNSNLKKKSFFSKENAILVLLIISIGHSFYLQKQVSDAYDAATEAADNASDAYYAATEAADNASDAYSAASEAAEYSFANQCNYCP